MIGGAVGIARGDKAILAQISQRFGPFLRQVLIMQPAAHVLKQLPPSGAQLLALDVGGRLASLKELRPDVRFTPVSLNPADWPPALLGADAVAAWDVRLTPALLEAAWRVLRPGGRLIVANPLQRFDTRYGATLTNTGFVRLLIEPLSEAGGLLLRGERPHTSSDTTARIRTVASADSPAQTLETYRGRFVHVLVYQTPNLPPWKLAPGTVVTWQAVTTQGVPPRLLVFSSLPKAVAFMQPAVLQGRLSGVNKVPKYRREVVMSWRCEVAFNPTLDELKDDLARLTIDPALAEVPDE